MKWITPKTDWDKDSRLNARDYNRILNNLRVLEALINAVYCTLALEEMGADKEYSSWYFAREFNVVERNLSAVNQAAFKKNIGEDKTFFDNGPFIDYAELNRIEGAVLDFYETGITHQKTLPRLAIRLGRGKGGIG